MRRLPRERFRRRQFRHKLPRVSSEREALIGSRARLTRRCVQAVSRRGRRGAREGKAPGRGTALPPACGSGRCGDRPGARAPWRAGIRPPPAAGATGVSKTRSAPLVHVHCFFQGLPGLELRLVRRRNLDLIACARITSLGRFTPRNNKRSETNETNFRSCATRSRWSRAAATPAAWGCSPDWPFTSS